jgi:hypothetical protein
VITAGIAVAAAFSPARPVGVRPADAVWAAAFAALVTLAGSRSKQGALLWLAGVTAVVSVRGDMVAVILGVAALVGAIAVVAAGRRSAAAGSAISGLAVLALLWGPSYGFTGLPSIVAAAAVAPALWEGWRSLGSAGRRRTVVTGLVISALVVVGSVLAGVAALSVRTKLTDAAQQARDGLALVRDGKVEDAAPTLDSSAAGFAQSSDSLSSALAFPGRLIPVVGHQIEALRRVSDAGEDLASTASGAAQRANYRSLRSEGGRIDLAQMAAMREPVDASLAAARRAQQVVADVRSPWLLAPLADKLDELDNELVDTVPSAELASRALDVAPTLLGGSGPQRYLLQFTTPGESRAAGGYVGTYGVLVAENGKLRLDLTGSTEDLNIPPGDPPRAFDPPPGWNELYSTFRVDHFPGNLTADPDWPTGTGVARQLYAQVPEVGDVQGALYADPTALAAFLEITGPVYVPGLNEELTSENVEQYLLVQQYVTYNSDDDATNLARRQVLGNVTRAVFDALSSRDLPSLRSMLDVLGPAVAGGHLKLSVFDDRSESLLNETGLSGAWAPSPNADYVSMRTTDLLSNKIDTFIRRSVAVEVDHVPDSGAVHSTITVTLTNTAPSSGLPWYIIGNYEGLPGGTSRDGVAVYSPMGLESATLDGEPVDMRRGRYAAGNVYTLPVLLAPGESRRLSLTMKGTVPEGLPYVLDLLPQPRADADNYSVTVSEPNSTSTAFDGPLTTQQLVGGTAVR